MSRYVVRLIASLKPDLHFNFSTKLGEEMLATIP